MTPKMSRSALPIRWDMSDVLGSPEIFDTANPESRAELRSERNAPIGILPDGSSSVIITEEAISVISAGSASDAAV